MKNVIVHLAFIGMVVGFVVSATHAEEEKNYKFKVETLESQPVITMRFKVAPESAKISAKYAEAFTAVFAHVFAQGGEPIGMPFGRYHSVSNESLEIEAGVRVKKAIKGKGEIKASELPAGKVVTTIHHGPYEELGLAHQALNKWAIDHGYTPASPLWELYLTDPGQEPDQSKWQTQLFQPIKKATRNEKAGEDTKSGQ